MRRPLLAAASFIALALAACGGPSDEDVLTQDKIRASESAPELPDIELSENPDPPPAPPEPEEPTLNELDNEIDGNVIEAGVPGSIPPAFQALWARVPSDCQPGDVVGTAMLITPDAIGLAGTVGELRGVLGDYPRRFSGRFEYPDGERREDLTLSSRNVLVRSSGGESSTYRRCAAEGPTG